jgi:hypothetical protein
MGANMTAKTNRAIAAAAAAAIALTSVSFTPAMAAPVSKKPAIAAHNTDFSARRKRARGVDNRAALGAFLGVVGTIATLAARDRYYRDYGYGPHYGYAPYRAYGYAPYRAYGYAPYRAYGYAPYRAYGYAPRYAVPYGYVPY